MAADYVTLKKRPLLMTGTWNASTGTEAITDEDLESIVTAYSSGVLDNAVVKIGHVDARFNTYAEDGTPAYGQITNLSIEDGVLYGDYEHMPSSLAESLDSAYPRSSVELARNVILRDQEGNVVHEFGCVLTANALLGATPPAVKGLSTKMSSAAAKSSGTPVFLEINTAQFALSSDGESRFALPGGGTANDLAEKLRATVTQTHSAETTWAYLIDFTDDKAIFGVEGYDDSVTYEQSYSVGDNGLPTLSGDPVQVVKETRWIREDGEPVAAAEKNDDDTPDVHPDTSENSDSVHEDTTPDVPEDSTQTPEAPPQQGETQMAILDNDKAADLRRKYGLPENAPYETILENVLADQSGANYVPPGSDETPNETVREQQVSEQRNNPNFSDGEAETTQVETPKVKDDEDDAELDTSKVSTAALSAMQSKFADMEAKFAARDAAETSARRDGLVTKWFRAGLIHDDEAERVRKRLDRDENLTTELIEERTPMFSTSEVGHGKTEPSFFAQGTDPVAAQLESDDAAFGATSK